MIVHAKSEQQIIFMPYSVKTHAKSEQQIIFMPYLVNDKCKVRAAKACTSRVNI